MITSYNLDFDIAAVVILFLEIIYVRVQYSHDKYSSRLFIMLLHSSFLLAIVDIISSLMLSGNIQWASSGLTKFTCSFYYLLSAFTIMVFYRYIVEYLDIKPERTVSYYVMTFFPFFFILECLVANCFANILFSGGEYGYFSYGPLISIIYYYPVYYFVLTIIQMIRNRKRIIMKQSLPVLAYMVSTIIAVVLQYFFQNVMVMSFGFAVALLIMMLSLETPDYRKLVKTTELLEAVRGEFDYQSEMNASLVAEMNKEIHEPVERLLEKNNTYDVNELNDAQAELHECINGYGEIIYSSLVNAKEFNSIGNSVQEIKTKEYSIKELADKVCNIMTPMIKESSNSIELDIEPTLPDRLVGDADTLKHILINLISKSNENTQGGLITVGIYGRKIESDSINLILTVEDKGKGMSRDTIRTLLQFNTKSKKWNKEFFNGGYFRIRIAKRMIEKMHGKLHINSEVEKGNKYTLVLPQGIVK